jgi:hypothetical protein
MARYEPPKIDPPKRQGNYPERLSDCEIALEPVFQDLVALAFAHGWGPAETRRALRRLIASHKRTDEENARFEAELAIMRAMERARQ